MSEQEKTRRRQIRARKHRKTARAQAAAAPQPNRPLMYIGWPLLTMAAAFGIFTLFDDPGPALLTLGISFIGFVVILGWGELWPWAAKRGIRQPKAFGISVGVTAAALWTGYVLAVPLQIVSSAGATPIDQNTVLWLIILPALVIFFSCWSLFYRLAKAGVLFNNTPDPSA